MKCCAWAFVVSLVAGLPCASQDEPVGALKLKTLDLVYTIKDIGGKVLDLKVKETDTELRIELAADVLFDFDKGDIWPKPRRCSARLPISFARRPKAACGLKGTPTAKGRPLITKSYRCAGPTP